MKRKILFIGVLFSFCLFIVKLVQILKVLIYLVKERLLRETYILQGDVTLIKVNEHTVYKLPTETDFIILIFFFVLLLTFIIFYKKTRKK